MAVLFKGMEAPKDCIVCPFGWNGCNKQHDFVYMGCRPDNCHLIEVHEPHGRLIDADALIEFIENRYEITWKDDYEGGIKDACVDILEKISTMPTVIHACD